MLAVDPRENVDAPFLPEDLGVKHVFQLNGVYHLKILFSQSCWWLASLSCLKNVRK